MPDPAVAGSALPLVVDPAGAREPGEGALDLAARTVADIHDDAAAQAARGEEDPAARRGEIAAVSGESPDEPGVGGEVDVHGVVGARQGPPGLVGAPGAELQERVLAQDAVVDEAVVVARGVVVRQHEPRRRFHPEHAGAPVVGVAGIAEHRRHDQVAGIDLPAQLAREEDVPALLDVAVAGVGLPALIR